MSAQHTLRARIKDDIGTLLSEGYVLASCPITGITFQLKIASLGKIPQIYSMTAPWASITECRKLIKHNSLSNLTSEVLAGCILTLAGPQGYGLIECQTMNALESNAALRMASHEVLCKLLRVLDRMDKAGAVASPHIALPEITATINSSLSEWSKELVRYIPRAAVTEILEIAAQDGIHILSKEEKNKLTLARVVAQKPRLAKYEVEFAKSATAAEAHEQFKAKKKEAKEIWNELLSDAAVIPDAVQISTGLAATMKVLLTGHALSHCNPALRAKLVTAITKINHKRSQTLARIIKEAYDPYDPMSKDTEVLLDEVSFKNEQPATTKLSLAELIASKKAAQQAAKKDTDAPEDF